MNNYLSLVTLRLLLSSFASVRSVHSRPVQARDLKLRTEKGRQVDATENFLQPVAVTLAVATQSTAIGSSKIENRVVPVGGVRRGERQAATQVNDLGEIVTRL